MKDKLLHNKFKQLCELKGWTPGTNEGNYGMDYLRFYGGWLIVQYGPNGAEDNILGNLRRESEDMVNTIEFATDVINAERGAA